MRSAMFALVAALEVGLVVPWAQGPLMATGLDSLDGNQRDLAGPTDATTPLHVPALQRAFLAGGRRMIAHEVFDRERHYSEEETFETEIVANELDEANNLLFVITARVFTGEPGVFAAAPPILRVYDVSNPTDLSQAQLFQVDLLQTSDEPATQMRVIPDDKKLLLIRRLSVTVWDYTNPANLVEGIEVPLGDGATGLFLSTCPQDTRQVFRLDQCVVQPGIDSLGQPIKRAFFRAGTFYSGAATKGGRTIVALELAADYQTGAFSPWVFDPLESTCPVVDAVSVAENASHDLTLYHDVASSRWYLISVGGIQHGVRIFDVTDFPTSGFVPHATKTTWGPLGSLAELQAVEVVDVNFPILAILGRHSFLAVKFDDMANDEFDGELFGAGPPGDTLLMREGAASAPQYKLWSNNGTGTDHRFKIIDVGKLLLRDPAAATERYYAPGDSDTSAYIPEYSSVYSTNFNGLVRYDVSLPPTAEPVMDSYLPAFDDTVNPSTLVPIEHMIAARYDVPGDPYDWGLFGNTATGAFLHWGVNDQTKDPELVDFVDGKDAMPSPWPAWPVAHQKYGQDVELAPNVHSGRPMIAMDYYDVAADDWRIGIYDLVDKVWGPPQPAPQLSGLHPPVWDLCLSESIVQTDPTEERRQWVFGGMVGGFFVAEVTDAQGNWSVVDHRSTDGGGPIGGYDFAEVRGIGHFSGIHDRIWVSLSDDNDRNNRFGFAVYSFDPVAGSIGASPLAVLLDEPTPAAQDDYPGLYLKGGSRLRSWTFGNETQIFVGTFNGHVLQISYLQHDDSIHTGGGRYWHNGSFYSELSDCQVANVAAPGLPPVLRVCASQFLETFAIVQPFGWE